MAYDMNDGGNAVYHRLTLEGREKLTVGGVEDVERFDESCIVMSTCAGTLGAMLHLERAEAHQLHLLVGLQTLGNGGQGGVDSSLGSLLGQAGLLGDGIDQFGFIHGFFLLKIFSLV